MNFPVAQVDLWVADEWVSLLGQFLGDDGSELALGDVEGQCATGNGSGGGVFELLHGVLKLTPATIFMLAGLGTIPIIVYVVWLLPGEGPDLVRFVWQNADRFTLAHDVSDGDLALALAEGAAWSGVDAPSAGAAAGERIGVVVALPPGDSVEWADGIELGVAG